MRRITTSQLKWPMRISIFVIITLTLAPSLAAYLMGVNAWIRPWQSPLFFSMPQSYFYISALLLLIIINAIVLTYLKKGIYRYLSVCLLFALLATLFAISFSDVLFNLLSKNTHITLNPFLSLWVWLNLSNHDQALYSACLGLSLVTTALALFFLQKEGYNVLGDAKFATPVDTSKAGLFYFTGILVGKSWGQALRVGGFEHVLGFAPTGSGKTSAIAIPNLLTWHGSCIANDLKLSLWQTTKAYREEKLHNKCFLFSPTDTTKTTHRYNPLCAIRTEAQHLVADCQRLSYLLVPNQPKESPMWGQLARQLLVALLLYVKINDGKDANLSQVNALLKQENLSDWLSTLNTLPDYPAAFYENSQTFLSQPEKTQGSTLATLAAQFELYGDPNIAYATSACDFDIHTLRKEKITIYIGIPANDLTRLAPLMSIFWEQVIYAMLSHLPDASEQVPLLCLIDEFGALNRLDVLRNGLKLLREYRVRCVLLIQQLAQLKEHYTKEEAETFLSIKTKIAFKPDSLEDAEYLSKLLGNKTVKVKSGSNSAHETGGSTTKSYNYQAIPLMCADKLMRMRENQALIIQSGKRPVLAKQYRWYQEAERHLVGKLKQIFSSVFIQCCLPIKKNN